MTKKERLLRRAMQLEDKWRKTRSEKDWEKYLKAKQEYDDCRE